MCGESAYLTDGPYNLRLARSKKNLNGVSFTKYKKKVCFEETTPPILTHRKRVLGKKPDPLIKSTKNPEDILAQITQMWTFKQEVRSI